MGNIDTTYKHLIGAESSPTQKHKLGKQRITVTKFIKHLQLDDKLKDSCGDKSQQYNRLGCIFTFR